MNIKNEGRKPWLFATYIEVNGLTLGSINSSKRSDDYDECRKMAMLNIRLFFFFFNTLRKESI